MRESSSASGQYVLSGMEGVTVRHLLLVDPHGQVKTCSWVLNTHALWFWSVFKPIVCAPVWLGADPWSGVPECWSSRTFPHGEPDAYHFWEQRTASETTNTTNSLTHIHSFSWCLPFGTKWACSYHKIWLFGNTMMTAWWRMCRPSCTSISFKQCYV